MADSLDRPFCLEALGSVLAAQLSHIAVVSRLRLDAHASRRDDALARGGRALPAPDADQKIAMHYLHKA